MEGGGKGKRKGKVEGGSGPGLGYDGGRRIIIIGGRRGVVWCGWVGRLKVSP